MFVVFFYELAQYLSSFVHLQNEEKTIVYVLSKKEDSLSDTGEIPTPPPTIPSKPEVFFIKYRTKEDAVKAVADIQGLEQKNN